MFFRLTRSLLVCGVALAAVSCSRTPKPALVRLAVLRFENLSPDTAPDWIGRALSDIVSAKLAGSNELYVIPTARLHQFEAGLGARAVAAPGVSAEAPLAVAVGANRIGYGTYEVVAGRLRARLTIEDPTAHRAAQGPIEVQVGQTDVIGAGTALAKAISANAQPYGTSSETALEAYSRALETADPAAVAGGAQRAIAADPNFGGPYSMLAEVVARQQGRAPAEAVLQQALARGDAMRPPMDRVRVAMLDASLRDDAGALGRAIGEYVKTAPLDPAAWIAIAQFQSRQHSYRQAVDAYQRSLQIEPEDATAWNELGYTAVYAGSFDTARGAIQRYQQLRPDDPNPLDTMGDIELMSGRPAEAERSYLAAVKKNPQFLGGADLYKAATARLMTGDVAGADGILKNGAEALAASPEWLWLSGRRSQAFAKLSADASKLPREAQGRAFTHLTIWAMLLGDRAAAASAAQQAGAATTPANSGFVAVARFVSLPPASPAEWAARAAQMFPNAPANSIKDYSLAYALLLNQQFDAAVPVLTQLEQHSVVNGDRSAALELAWALVETGRWKDAAPFAALNSTPNIGATSVFVPMYFPRIFQVRAAIAEHEGKAAEAQENRRIYTALGGK